MLDEPYITKVVRLGFFRFEAHCVCGWKSVIRWTYHKAIDDAQDHIAF